MIIDWLVIFLYLIGITLIGIKAVKKVKAASNFFITDRKFGKIINYNSKYTLIEIYVKQDLWNHNPRVGDSDPSSVK